MGELEFWMKCLGAVVVFVVAVPSKLKDWDSWRHGRVQRLKELRELALTMTPELGQAQHLQRFAAELGSEALLGGNGFDHAQRLAVLRMRDSVAVVQRYQRARGMVKLVAEESRFCWRSPRFEWSWYRMAWKMAYFLMYLLCCILAFSPMLVVSLKAPSAHFVWPDMQAQVLALLCFLPAGIFCLLFAIGINDAEELVAIQADEELGELPVDLAREG